MPPSQPSSRAAYKSEPEPTKTDHCGAASRYAARFFASPDESLTPTMLACAASCRSRPAAIGRCVRSEEHTSELQSLAYLVCRLLLEKKKENRRRHRRLTHSRRQRRRRPP